MSEFTYYITDESFDYGAGSIEAHTYHGFKVDIDKNDNVDLTTLEGTGDFVDEVERIKTYDDLLDFLLKNEEYIQDPIDEECLEEFKGFVQENIQRMKKIA